jgi:hypothetical protein
MKAQEMGSKVCLITAKGLDCCGMKDCKIVHGLEERTVFGLAPWRASSFPNYKNIGLPLLGGQLTNFIATTTTGGWICIDFAKKAGCLCLGGCRIVD